MIAFSTIGSLYRIFSKYRWHLLALSVLGFVGAILEGIGINAAVPLLSFFTGGGSPTDFISRNIVHLFGILHIPFKFSYLLGFILVLFVLRAFSVGIFAYVRSWISADFLGNESEDMLRRTLLASWPFLLKQKIGNLQNTLVRDIQRSGNLLEVVGQVIQSSTGFLMYLLVAVNISVIMTVLALASGVFLVLCVRPFLARTRRLAYDMAATEKQYGQFLSEHIYGMKAVKAAGMEGRAIESGNVFVRSLRTLGVNIAYGKSIGSSVFQPFSLAFIIVLFMITYKSPGFSIIAFAAELYLIQKIFTYLESGQNALQAISELVPYARNVYEFKQTLDEHREVGTSGSKPFVFTRDISFKNVSFAYTDHGHTLHNVSFSVKRGETVGIIGPSGAGKTSLADLLLRLFRPSSGEILLDDVSTEDIALHAWRSHVGYVSQDVFLFNGTIGDNIRFYRPDLSEKEIEAAAKQANIYDFVIGLPDGFKSIVGDRGVMLSGGQRQRIALARALAGHPAILVLDEATSALDTASEKLIQEAISKLHGTVTVFVIAHRLSTIEDADMLVVLQKGRVTEVGSPSELRANPDSYFSRH